MRVRCGFILILFWMVLPLKAQLPAEEGIIFTGINKPNSDIYWLSIDGLQWENLTQTFTNYEYGPTVSPDGTQIAFVKLLVAGALGNLYILNLQTRKLRRITHHPAHDTSPAWSPDGKQIAFSGISYFPTCQTFLLVPDKTTHKASGEISVLFLCRLQPSRMSFSLRERITQKANDYVL